MLCLKIPRGVGLILRDNLTGRIMRVDPTDLPRARNEVKVILDGTRPIGAVTRLNPDEGGRLKLGITAKGWAIGTTLKPPQDIQNTEGAA